jgi:hypothetical protein
MITDYREGHCNWSAVRYEARIDKLEAKLKESDDARRLAEVDVARLAGHLDAIYRQHWYQIWRPERPQDDGYRPNNLSRHGFFFLAAWANDNMPTNGILGTPSSDSIRSTPDPSYLGYDNFNSSIVDSENQNDRPLFKSLYRYLSSCLSYLAPQEWLDERPAGTTVNYRIDRTSPFSLYPRSSRYSRERLFIRVPKVWQDGLRWT